MYEVQGGGGFHSSHFPMAPIETRGVKRPQSHLPIHTSNFPLMAASWRGVKLQLSLAFGLAPLLNRILTTSAWPNELALWRGIKPPKPAIRERIQLDVRRRGVHPFTHLRLECPLWHPFPGDVPRCLSAQTLYNYTMMLTMSERASCLVYLPRNEEVCSFFPTSHGSLRSEWSWVPLLALYLHFDKHRTVFAVCLDQNFYLDQAI